MDRQRYARMVDQLEAAQRQMQQLLTEMDELLELQAQLEEAAGLATDDLHLLPQQ